MREEIETIGEDEPVPIEVLLGVYHAFHANDNTFDNGLGFLDSLWKKLHRPFQLNWNVPELKNKIRNSENPQQVFLDTLRNILTAQMIEYYGL